MKKILILHSEYRNLGGEDIAVKNEINLLKKHFEVKTFITSNKIQNIFQLKNRKIKKEILVFKPDIIYIHNLWFALGLGIFNLLKNKDFQVLIKFHNFRYYCTSSWFVKKHLNGSLICPACGLNYKKGSIFNKYFPNSYIKSIYANYFGSRFFKIVLSFNFKILVLTNFHKQFLVNLGVDPNKIFLLHNYIEFKSSGKNSQKDDYFIYAGRISLEKGIEELILAHSLSKVNNIQLKIVGSGPELPYLRKLFKDYNVEFLGPKSNSEVINLIQNSKAVLTATKLYEGQPTLLCEASKMSVPSVFPQTGGISEFFPENYPFTFEQYNYEDLKNKINLLIDQKKLNKISKQNFNFINSLICEEKIIKEFSKVINDE